MLDLKINEPSRALTQFETPVTVFEALPISEYQFDLLFQFRYVVHRQDVGFYTPVVFDVRYSYTENKFDDFTTKNWLLTLAEPFIEGALFMNHTSQFISDMLKGQEAGFNRKTLLDDIRNTVKGRDALWYSDWGVPPVTRQSQRVVVYDLDVAGSMLNPANVVASLPNWIAQKFPAFNSAHIFNAEITAGYTTKTV